MLVHAAGSGVGTAGIQIARALGCFVGCFVIGTSRTQDKLDRRNELYLNPNRSSDETEEMRQLSEELAAAGFAREFQDPMYQHVAMALARRKEPRGAPLSPEQVKEQERIANEVVEEILAEEPR